VEVGALFFYTGLIGSLLGFGRLMQALWMGTGVFIAPIVAIGAGIVLSFAGVYLAARGKRSHWQPVLDTEVARWQAEPAATLRLKLSSGPVVYEMAVLTTASNLQVEVELIEDTQEYIHVALAVDDGTMPASIMPLCTSFVQSTPFGGR
jgi:hypothetical protein